MRRETQIYYPAAIIADRGTQGHKSVHKRIKYLFTLAQATKQMVVKLLE